MWLRGSGESSTLRNAKLYSKERSWGSRHCNAVLCFDPLLSIAGERKTLPTLKRARELLSFPFLLQREQANFSGVVLEWLGAAETVRREGVLSRESGGYARQGNGLILRRYKASPSLSFHWPVRELELSDDPLWVYALMSVFWQVPGELATPGENK